MSEENINAALRARELDIASPHVREGETDPDTWHLVADTTWTRGPLSIWVFRSHGVDSMCFECALADSQWSAFIGRINKGETPQPLADEIIDALWSEMDESADGAHVWGTPAAGTREYFRDELAKWIERNRGAGSNV